MMHTYLTSSWNYTRKQSKANDIEVVYVLLKPIPTNLESQES